MNPILVYGVGTALASILLNLLLFFLGYHNDLEKLTSPVMVAAGVIGLLIPIVGITLGVRARREDSDHGAMTYGQGVGTGVMTALLYGLVMAVFSYLYGTEINPDYPELLRQQQENVMAARGLSSADIDRAMPFARIFTSPVFTAITSIFVSLILGTIVALVAAAFLKRGAQTGGEPPPLSPSVNP